MAMIKKLPVIGVPLGDPAGIGPEIAIKAALMEEVRSAAHVVLIGQKEVFWHAREHFSFDYSGLDLHFVEGPSISGFEFGKIQANCGKAAYDAIRESAKMALDNRIDAIATTPINKESLRAAKIDTIGHTELLGEFTGTKNLMTLFQTNQLRVFFLTRHLSLMDASKRTGIRPFRNGFEEPPESSFLRGWRIPIRRKGPAAAGGLPLAAAD